MIDAGSGMTKAGYAGSDEPHIVFPSLVGRPRNTPTPDTPGTCHVNAQVGDESIRDYLTRRCPVQHGVVANWSDMEALYHYTLNKALNYAEGQQPVLLSESPSATLADRNRLCQMMFETFRVPATSLVIQAVLALFSNGCTTGVVVDSGDGVTHSVPIYEGHALLPTITRSEIGGNDLTDHLLRLLTELGYSFTTLAERDSVRVMKDNLAYVAREYEAELQMAASDATTEKSHELPDGQVITFGVERFRCTEPLFRPSLLGKDSCRGLSELVNDSVAKCNPELHKSMYKNIYLAGGNTIYRGFDARLRQDLKKVQLTFCS